MFTNFLKSYFRLDNVIVKQTLFVPLKQIELRRWFLKPFLLIQPEKRHFPPYLSYYIAFL